MAEIKYTARMALTDIINGKNPDKVMAWAKNEIDKLDKKNAKRKATEGEIKADNKPIADAILVALAKGQMVSPDLAQTVGVSTQKVNGVAGEMVKLGLVTKTKVKVKNKGELTAYALVATAEVANEEVTEETTEEVTEEVKGE